jgi:hypothetical protein
MIFIRHYRTFRICAVCFYNFLCLVVEKIRVTVLACSFEMVNFENAFINSPVIRGPKAAILTHCRLLHAKNSRIQYRKSRTLIRSPATCPYQICSYLKKLRLSKLGELPKGIAPFRAFQYNITGFFTTIPKKCCVNQNGLRYH